MFKSSHRLAVLLAALVLAPPAFAQPSFGQSSLGLSRIEASMGLTSTGGQTRADGRLSGDFRISEAHGLQFDLSLTDYPGGYLGQIDGHLYMAPSERSKYGLFASLADVSGREATVAYAGAEGLFALGDATTLEARAGIGYARPGNLDFVAIEGRLAHALSDEFGLFAAAQATEIQEQRLDTVAWAAELGLSWQPRQSPFEVTAAFGTTGLSGRDSAPADRYLRIGLTWSFGAEHGTGRSLASRGFTSPRPFDPLLHRGSF